MVSDENMLKKIKFIIMFFLGIILIIKPNSFLSILLFMLGIYLIIIGYNAFISCIVFIKFHKVWIYNGIKSSVLLLFGCILIFNTTGVAVVISSALFVIIGLLLAIVGIMAIIKTREKSAGIMFIVLGLLIAIFPLGVSHFITRLIGISLVFLSIYLLTTINTKSS